MDPLGATLVVILITQFTRQFLPNAVAWLWQAGLYWVVPLQYRAHRTFTDPGSLLYIPYPASLFTRFFKIISRGNLIAMSLIAAFSYPIFSYFDRQAFDDFIWILLSISPLCCASYFPLRLSQIQREECGADIFIHDLGSMAGLLLGFYHAYQLLAIS